MKKRKLIFNIYEQLSDKVEPKAITTNHLIPVLKEIPFDGAVCFTFSDGSKLMATKHDYVKNETYDIHWN